MSSTVITVLVIIGAILVLLIVAAIVGHLMPEVHKVGDTVWYPLHTPIMLGQTKPLYWGEGVVTAIKPKALLVKDADGKLRSIKRESVYKQEPGK